MTKGKLIVIDGTDGSGKQTQTALLIEKLKAQGYDCESIDFPQYSKNFFGGMVRQYLDGAFGTTAEVHPKLASILYAADRWESKNKIEHWLNESKVVVLDRYYTSNLIHQSTKLPDDKLDEFSDWETKMEFEIFKIPKPDLVIYLRVAPEISMQLIKQRGQGNDGHENLDHLTKAANRCQQMAQKFNWQTIDCAPDNKLLSKDDISSQVWEKVESILSK